MNLNRLLGSGMVLATMTLAGAASATAVIPGPAFTFGGSYYTVTGLGFEALDNSTLTGFVYQNLGQADTIVLADPAGTILDSIGTPADTPNDAVSVNWSLSAGSQYWLLQTVSANEQLSAYGDPLPSDADIQIIQSGTFDDSIPLAVSNSNGWGVNEFWAGFDDIATDAAVVPEPAIWMTMLAGIFGIGGVLRRSRPRRSGAVTAAPRTWHNRPVPQYAPRSEFS